MKVTLNRNARTVRLGGLALVLAAAAFVGVFSYLAAAFDYPDVLDGRAADVLPALLETGVTGRAVWALYAVLPLLLLPGAVGAYAALHAASEGAARLGQALATVAALAMVLGLARWPTVHWALAQGYAAADPAGRDVLAAVFRGLNLYLGNYLGEFVGELGLYGFFACTAHAARRDGRFPRWFGPVGFAVAAVGAVAAFRNVADVVDPVNEVANVLLPLWLAVLGAGLVRYGAREGVAPAGRAASQQKPGRPSDVRDQDTVVTGRRA
jgi:hypothetical protein